MDKVDFIEIATFCAKRYKDAHNRYSGTLFVGISGSNKVQCSTTPHILQNAYQCILIHGRLDGLRDTFYYVEIIKEDGTVKGSFLDDVFNLRAESGRNLWLKLFYNNTCFYSLSGAFDKNMPKIWELYTKIRYLKTYSEQQVVRDLFDKDEKIFELESQIEDLNYKDQLLKQERDQYKNMLDEIKSMVESKSK